MPISPDVLADINNSALETFIDKGTVFKQNIANKPMLDAFNSSAGKFTGGNDNVSFAVRAGQGGLSLQGFTGDDQVGYGNPTGIKRVRFPWKEHHIGMVVTMTELKKDGIDVTESGASQSTNSMSEREAQALANVLEEKNEALAEDYAFSLDRLIHGDGTSDSKAIAGIQSLVLANPGLGATGTLNRTANTWWRNRAATAAANAAGTGFNAITSNTAGGGALLQFLQEEKRRLSKFKQGSTKWKMFAGSDFISAMEKELRANGSYSQTGFTSGGTDGAMADVKFAGMEITWDPTLDDLNLAKRMYWLDMGRTGIKLMYMDGQRMKKHNPARPYDRYVMYNGITMTGVMVAKQLNTSGVYDIA